jgi:ABC-type enterochelin transport system ATPase subunit
MKDGKILFDDTTETAVTKENLDNVFGVNSQLVNLGNKKLCLINN